MERAKQRYGKVRALVWACVLLVILVADRPALAEDAVWWPIQVKSYYGEYDASQKKPGHVSASLRRPKLEEWVPPGLASKSYRIGVSFPHLKDSYWVAVNYGIIREASRFGVGVTLVEAGGYGELERQVEQLRELARQKVDGIIVGSISYDGNDAVIREIRKQGIPVVEVINDVRAPEVSAKAMVSFYDMGFYAGEFVVGHAENAGHRNIRIAFFPGPEKSGWAPDTLEGFRDALSYFPGKADIVDIRWGDTGKVQQSKLVSEALQKTGALEYVVGNAVAAEVAPDILKSMGREQLTTVVSTYIIPSLYDVISAGRVAAAPSDLTVFQGRMAVDMMARILNGEQPGKDFPFRSGPFIPLITPENIDHFPYEGLFGPRDFRPVFNLEPRQ